MEAAESPCWDLENIVKIFGLASHGKASKSFMMAITYRSSRFLSYVSQTEAIMVAGQ